MKTLSAFLLLLPSIQRDFFLEIPAVMHQIPEPSRCSFSWSDGQPELQQTAHVFCQALIFCVLSSFSAISGLPRRYSTWETYEQKSCRPEKQSTKVSIKNRKGFLCQILHRHHSWRHKQKKSVCCPQPSTTTLQNWKQTSSVQAQRNRMSIDKFSQDAQGCLQYLLWVKLP